MVTWIEHVAKWRDCQLCPLCRQRDRICLARGSIPADVVFCGEAPGASEDARGVPFDGPAGNLLDQIVERAVPKEVSRLFCNLVACYPREAKERGDNEPERDEILACRPRLYELINLAQPRLIVCVGGLATEYVDHSAGVSCVDIVHPAFILARMPLVQKSQAINKCIVVIRCAVDGMLQSERRPFTKWGQDNADLTQGRGLRQRYDTFINREEDIPF